MTLSLETSKKENEFKNGPSSFPVLPRQQINCSGCGSCQSSIKQLSEKQGIPIRIRTNVMINVRRSVWEKNLIDRSLHLKSSLAHHGIASLRYLTYWWVLIPSRSPMFHEQNFCGFVCRPLSTWFECFFLVHRYTTISARLKKGIHPMATVIAE